MLPKAAGRGQHFQDWGHSFSRYWPTLSTKNQSDCRICYRAHLEKNDGSYLPQMVFFSGLSGSPHTLTSVKKNHFWKQWRNSPTVGCATALYLFFLIQLLFFYAFMYYLLIDWFIDWIVYLFFLCPHSTLSQKLFSCNLAISLAQDVGETKRQQCPHLCAWGNSL